MPVKDERNDSYPVKSVQAIITPHALRDFPDFIEYLKPASQDPLLQ